MVFFLKSKLLTKIEGKLPRVLLALAGLLFISFCFFGFVIPQTPGRMVRASASLFKDFPIWSFISSMPLSTRTSPDSVAILVIFFSVLAFSAYGLAVFLVWKYQANSKAKGIVLGSSLTFFFLSVWFLPNFNTDIYNYIMRGRVAAVHHDNPYYTPVDEFSHDPIYPYASSKYTDEPGGKLPAWMYINIFLAKIAGDDVVTNVLLYRIAFFIFNLANVALIALILKKLNSRYLFSGILMYAWNPIVALMGQSKTDTVMLFYLLLAIWLLVTERHKLAVVSMSLSVFVKLFTLPLVGVYMLREIRLKRWRPLVISFLLFGLTMVLVFLPFWQGWELLTHHINALDEGGASAPPAFKMILIVVFGILVLWVGLSQNGSNEKLLHGWAIVMLFFSLFLTKLGLAWYLIVLVGIVSLNHNWTTILVTIALAFSSFLFNVWYTTFTGDFKVHELFKVHSFIVYITPPIITLLLLSTIAIYKRLKQKRNSIKEIGSDISFQIVDSTRDDLIQQNDFNNNGTTNLLRVLTYHRVANPEKTSMLDPSLISSTPTVFEQHVRFLAKNYRVVSIEQVLNAVTNGHSLPRRAVLITFDDAYCDLKEIAWPILKRYRLPVTVFVPTAYPAQNYGSFWWDELYRSVMYTPKKVLNSSPIGRLILSTPAEREQSLRRLKTYIRTLPHHSAMATVKNTCLRLGNHQQNYRSVLDWEEIRQLASEGVVFCPHSQTHPILTQIPPEEVRREVAGSFEDLNREIGETLPVFCYPNGSHNDEVVKILEEENFLLAFTGIDGHNDLRSTNLRKLRRTNVTRRSTLPVLRLRLQTWFTYVDMLRHRQRNQISHL